MTDSQDNVKALRHAYQEWHSTLGGSVQTWLDLLADDVAMRSPGGSAPALDFAKPRQGKAEAEQYFASVLAAWEMVHFTPEVFIAEADRVVVISRVAFKYRETGKVVDSPKADVFRFRDGKVIEFTEFFDTAAALAATKPD